MLLGLIHFIIYYFFLKLKPKQWHTSGLKGTSMWILNIAQNGRSHRHLFIYLFFSLHFPQQALIHGI